MSAPVGVVMRRAAALDYVEVRCPHCRETRMLKRDSVRRRTESVPCQPCGCRNRSRRPAPPLKTPDYRSYWLTRYSMDEIRVLAAGLDAPDIPATEAEESDQ